MNEETIDLTLHIDDLDLLLCTLEHLDLKSVEDGFVPGSMSDDEIQEVYDNLQRVIKYLNSRIG